MKLARISLRDLFLLTALAAVSIGWWVDQSRIATRVMELDEEKASQEQLTKEIVLAQQRCELILKEWSELKARDEGRVDPPLPPKIKRAEEDEI